MDVVNAVTKQVASREGTNPTALRPLYEVVDTDALQRVVDSVGGETLTVEFTYSGYVVTVSGDGRASLDATDDTDAA